VACCGIKVAKPWQKGGTGMPGRDQNELRSWQVPPSLTIDWMKAFSTANAWKDGNDEHGNLARAFLLVRERMRDRKLASTDFRR
jgi:hypothetical protein